MVYSSLVWDIVAAVDAQPRDNASCNKCLISNQNTNTIMHSLIELLWKCMIYIQTVQTTHRSPSLFLLEHIIFSCRWCDFFLMTPNLCINCPQATILTRSVCFLTAPQNTKSGDILTAWWWWWWWCDEGFFCCCCCIFQRCNWGCMLLPINYNWR